MDSEPTIKRAPRVAIKLGDVDYTPVLIALLAIIITFVVLFLWKRRKPSRTDIILAGLCDSGKTCLFTQFLFSQEKETFTSIIENVGQYMTNKGPLRIIDIPGHERLRNRFFDQYKLLAKGIVFMVDSVTIQKDVRDVADFLFTILTDPAISSIPVLIICNKQDQTLAKGSTVVKSLLTKELNLVRTTRASTLESIDQSAKSGDFLGKRGQDFQFEHLSQNVDFFECSALKGEVEGLAKWIESNF